jgi:hypothetical protein
MRQITTVMVILIVCVFACGLANSTPSNDPQGKWEYCTASYLDMSTVHKTDFLCFPNDAIPDFNSVKKTLQSELSDSKPETAVITDFLNAFGNCGWELVTITARPGRDISVTHYFFKRRK